MRWGNRQNQSEKGGTYTVILLEYRVNVRGWAMAGIFLPLQRRVNPRDPGFLRQPGAFHVVHVE